MTMQYHFRPDFQSRMVKLTASLLMMAAATGGAAQSVESAVWKEHKAKFHYYGMTSLYTCDGIEGKVKQILVAMGARADAKVSASGCEHGMSAPSKTAWVSAQFHTLQPSAPGDTAAPVKAKWANVEIAPRRPLFMGEGECELVDQLRKTISENFVLRDVDYRTSCMPRQITLADYRVTAKALVAE
jgi:hypothetical protein